MTKSEIYNLNMVESDLVLTVHSTIFIQRRLEIEILDLNLNWVQLKGHTCLGMSELYRSSRRLFT